MKIAILHYSVPPVVGGVEAVIQAHAGLLLQAGYPVTLVAGAGDQAALPDGVDFFQIPEMDSRHPLVSQANQLLEAGKVPGDFDQITTRLEDALESALQSMDLVIVHNVFSKHFNLPLTAALVRLLDRGKFKRCIAWCHDFTWTSPHSRSRVHPGYPWDLLRTYREDIIYVTVSHQRQAELAGLFSCPTEFIQVIYDGVDPTDLYSLSQEGQALIERLGLRDADLIMLMPVRITQAKNIEFALQVVAELKRKGIRPKLVVTGPPDPHDAGDMAYYRSLIELRQQLGVYHETRFIYEAGASKDNEYTIGLPLVKELYRVSDVLFMPSHREGFGMPILEAGLIGMPIFATEIPAVQEIGGYDLFRFSPQDPANQVADWIIRWIGESSTQKLRQRIRQKYTWQKIFQHDILPLLTGEASH